MATKFVPNPAAPELLKRTPQMAAKLKHSADEAAEAARGLAPVRTGDYRDSIEGQSLPSEGKARVVAKDFKSIWLEFGTIHTPTFATLRRGVEAAGLRIESSGRYR